MKEFLIYAALAWGVVATVFLMAIFAAAARPTPEFVPEKPVEADDFALEVETREEELELVS
jgi:hypothetical protein